jgi:hypothetical protein
MIGTWTIVRLRAVEAVAFVLSETCTVNGNVPAEVGTPVTRPAIKPPGLLSDIPGGRDPLVRVQLL